jgi:DNA-binding CsgD family transcriptional regulator
VAIHLDTAAAFEARYGSNGDRIDVIAEHLAHSTSPADLERASRLWELAARRAFSVYAYAEAASLSRRALDALKLAAPADRARRCELLLLLGEALADSGRPRPAVEGAFGEAFDLAEAIGDGGRALRAALSARDAMQMEQQGRASFPAENDVWGRRLDRHALPGTRERVLADAFLGGLGLLRANDPEGYAALERARLLAWQLGDAEACWVAGTSLISFLAPLRTDENRKAIIEATLALPREGVPTHTLEQGLHRLCMALLEYSDRPRAAQVRDELVALAERTGGLSTRVWAARMVYYLAVVDGQLDAALQALRGVDEEVAGSGILTDPFNRAEAWGFRAMHLLGRLAQPELLARLDPGRRAAHRAHAGETAELRALFEAAGGVVDTRPRFVAHQAAASFLQNALVVGHRPTVATWASYWEGSLAVTSQLTLISRLRGEANALLGHPVDARELLVRGIHEAQAMPFRPEEALTRLALAELLVDRFPSEVEEARQHLRTAIPELREMGMRPALERAESLLARAQAEEGASRRRRAGGLTGREAEVLRLVAAGSTNRQISEELVLSIRTVERHIANIYAKIGARGKADATTFAIRHHLV